jgi:hypothetical protein
MEVDERSDRVAFLGGVIGALGPFAVAALAVPLRSLLTPADVALALVLPVLVAAFTGGRTAGLLGAVVAALSLDFFHIQPYLELRIAAKHDVVTAVLLFACAAGAAWMASSRELQASLAREGAATVRRVHRVAALSAEGADVDDVTHAVEAELIGVLHLLDCHFELAPADRRGAWLEISGGLGDHGGRLVVVGNGGFELPEAGVEIPVRGGGTELGRLVCLPTPGTAVRIEQRIAAVALADHLGSVLAARAV